MSDGERWRAADEALLPRLALTSCPVARLLTGCRPVLVHSPGVGNPCHRTCKLNKAKMDLDFLHLTSFSQAFSSL